MATKSPITGDEIKTSALSKEGRDNFDVIFAKRTVEEWAKIEGVTIFSDGEDKPRKISYSEFRKDFL